MYLSYIVDWKLYAWVKRGNRRKDVLKLISNSKQPLSAKNITDELKMSLSQISFLLKELSEKELILCLNPEDNIGKIYRLTQNGEEMMHEI